VVKVEILGIIMKVIAIAGLYWVAYLAIKETEAEKQRGRCPYADTLARLLAEQEQLNRTNFEAGKAMIRESYNATQTGKPANGNSNSNNRNR
jgi:hypothetical protein